MVIGVTLGVARLSPCWLYIRGAQLRGLRLRRRLQPGTVPHVERGIGIALQGQGLRGLAVDAGDDGFERRCVASQAQLDVPGHQALADSLTGPVALG